MKYILHDRKAAVLSFLTCIPQRPFRTRSGQSLGSEREATKPYTLSRLRLSVGVNLAAVLYDSDAIEKPTESVTTQRSSFVPSKYHQPPP